MTNEECFGEDSKPVATVNPLYLDDSEVQVEPSTDDPINRQSESDAFSEFDWRLVPSEIVRWAIRGSHEKSYVRLLVLGMFFCPEKWGYPSQRAMAATHGITVAYLNLMVRDFERTFKMSLPNRKSDSARLKYSEMVKERARLKRSS